MLRLPLLVLALAAPVAAQHAHPAHGHAPPAEATPDSAQVAFLASATQALRAFADPADALAAGFRPLGPDMPHMGQHWVHPGRAVGRAVDPAEPSMLTYLPVDGADVLTGAAWTVPVGPGEAPPDFPWPGAWHAHAGRLMDEAFGLVPHGVRDDGRPRLAMLHAWTGVANPDGVFAADNWALPFVRAGLAVPGAVTADAGRAVSLAAGYRAFFAEAIGRAAAPNADQRRRVDAVLDARSQAVRRLLPHHGPPDVAALEREWRTVGAEIEAAVPELWLSLSALFGTRGHTGTHAIDAEEGGHDALDDRRRHGDG